MQSENIKRLRLNQLKLISLIMVVVFVVMLIFNITWQKSYNEKYGFFRKTTAEVVGQKEIDGIYYDELKYYVNGVEYHITTDYASKNDTGDIITIYYDKDNPVGVIYSLDSRLIVLPILTSIFGALTIALIIVWIVGENEYKKREKLKAYLAYKEWLENSEKENSIKKVSKSKKSGTKLPTKKSTSKKVSASISTTKNSTKAKQSSKITNTSKTTQKPKSNNLATAKSTPNKTKNVKTATSNRTTKNSKNINSTT